MRTRNAFLSCTLALCLGNCGDAPVTFPRDSDRDGVRDENDACPYYAGTKDNKGCVAADYGKPCDFAGLFSNDARTGQENPAWGSPFAFCDPALTLNDARTFVPQSSATTRVPGKGVWVSDAIAAFRGFAFPYSTLAQRPPIQLRWTLKDRTRGVTAPIPADQYGIYQLMLPLPSNIASVTGDTPDVQIKIVAPWPESARRKQNPYSTTECTEKTGDLTVCNF